MPKGRAKHREPDESWSMGPVRAARFGRHAVLQSSFSSKAAHAEFLEKASAALPEMEASINELIAGLRSRIQLLDLLDVLSPVSTWTHLANPDIDRILRRRKERPETNKEDEKDSATEARGPY